MSRMSKMSKKSTLNFLFFSADLKVRIGQTRDLFDISVYAQNLKIIKARYSTKPKYTVHRYTVHFDITCIIPFVIFKPTIFIYFSKFDSWIKEHN